MRVATVAAVLLCAAVTATSAGRGFQEVVTEDGTYYTMSLYQASPNTLVSRHTHTHHSPELSRDVVIQACLSLILEEGVDDYFSDETLHQDDALSTHPSTCHTVK